jgi:tetratricopeptide (TPR) repeat protein
MRDLFGRVARARPLVVAIDDLQWADADGLAVLAELLRPPDAPPMLFVGTARPAGAGGERPSGVTDARDEGAALFGLPEDARVLPLERLAPEEAIDLARLLLEGDEATGASLAQVLASEARGHPLFLDELVRHARAHGGRARAPVQLDDALHARVAALDRRERELLEVLAVAGVALHRDVAMRAAGLAPADYARVAQSLRAGHLARGFGAKGKETIEPYHDRVREAVAARLDPLVRRKWHSGLASALEATPSPDADALSTHWLGAGDPEASARYALEAADQAFAAFAFERAARLYERGLALGKIDEARRQVLRIQRAEALARAGLGALAAREFIEAARVAAPDDALDLRRRAAEELMIAGRIDEGDDAFQQVLAAVGIGFPMTAMGALASLLLCRLALWLRGMGVRERGAPTPRALVRHDACAGVAQALSVIDMVRGAYFQSRTLLFALDLGEPSRVGRALAIEAAQIAAAGPRMATRTERLLAQATAIAQHAGDAEGIATVEVARAYALFLQGRFRDGFDVAERASRTMRERHLGTFWAQRSAELMTIWTLAWMGRLRELGTRVRRAVREAEQRGDLYARTSLCTGVPHLAFLRDGDAQEARAIALAATRKWTQRGYHNQHFWSLLALANVDLYEGDGRAAWARVDREWPRVSRALLSRVQTFAIETTHLRARAALGAATDERGSARARVLRVADRCARRLASIDSPLAPPFARIVDAGVAASRGDGEGAQLHLEASVAGFDAAGLELHAACARRRLARLQGGDEGRAIGARADAWMEGEGIADRDAMTEAIAPGFAR